MKNLDGLKQYSKKRNEDTFEKVNKAIANLKRGKKKITIAEVARKAEVSVATIYNNPALRERITQLKEVAKNVSNDGQEGPKGVKSENSTKVDELKNRNIELKKELETLKTENGLLLGQLKDLASENLELKTALEQYRKIKSFK